jgi:hypothetical protein
MKILICFLFSFGLVALAEWTVGRRTSDGYMWVGLLSFMLSLVLLSDVILKGYTS